MCGFAGILTAGRDFDVGPPLERMLAALAHRGPDGSGADVFDLPDGRRLGLGHARLAVLDVSDAGRQPMASPDGRLWTAFNGEIYNHLSIRERLGDADWKSGTDTETLLRAWGRFGEAAIDGFRGMFAMAVVDATDGRVWLVRDRLGVKPLYVARPRQGTWLFASEIRSLLASGLVARRVDPTAVASLLALGSTAPPETIVEGVESVGAGEVWRLEATEARVRRYWRPAFVARGERPAFSAGEAADRIGRTLREAAEIRMLSDVPVGVFLSGGIDSSAIVQAVTRGRGDVRTFSVSFAEREFDESRHAEAVAKAYGTRHESLVLTPADVLGKLPRAVGDYDSPSFDGLNTWFISEAVRAAGITVALSGLGGDELFAGYGYHRLMRRFDRPWSRWAAAAAGRILPLLTRDGAAYEKMRQAAAARGPLERYVALRQVMGPRLRRRLGEGFDAAMPVPPATAAMLCGEASALDPVNAFSLLDLQLYMQNTLLRDTDQMSMAHALEVRVPMLDHELVETVAAVPGAWKLSRHASAPGKGLLLRSLERPLPVSATSRKKMGFVLPWSRWLRGELGPVLDESLEDAAAAEACGLDPGGVSYVRTRFERRDRLVREADVLCLLVLLRWVRRHVLEAGPAFVPRRPVAAIP